MPKKLGQHLTNEFETDGYNINVKNDFKFKFQDKEIIIPRNEIHVAGYGSKSNKDHIIRCAKKISHSYILQLVDDYNLELTDYKIIREPDDQQKWGYATVVCEGILKELDDIGNKKIQRRVEGDGEVHKDNLMGTMLGYAYTMLRKRTEDRAVLRYFGLYQKGFYSESENLGEDYDYHSGGDYDKMPVRSVDSEMLSNIQQLAKSKNYTRESLEELARQIMELKPNEAVNWKLLPQFQLEKIYEALQVDSDLSIEQPVTPPSHSETVSNEPDYKEIIKQFKIDGQYEQVIFKDMIREALQIEVEDFSISNLTNEHNKILCEKWGLLNGQS